MRKEDRLPIILMVCFVLFILFAFISNGMNSESTVKNDASIHSDTPEEKQAKAESIVANMLKDATTTNKADGNDYSNLSESDYKSKCNELWHDDIFFSKTDLDGQYVKLDLFAEEPRYFNSVQDSDTTDFIKKYDIKRDFTLCGINRKDANSYVNGQITLYMPKSIDITIKTGGHYIVYGQIVEYSRTSSNGYNKCSLLPKYIEVK